MWVARDKDGRLFLYYQMPKRSKVTWNRKDHVPFLRIPSSWFAELKWTDKPLEVKIVTVSEGDVSVSQ